MCDIICDHATQLAYTAMSQQQFKKINKKEKQIKNKFIINDSGPNN